MGVRKLKQVKPLIKEPKYSRQNNFLPVALAQV